jgi:hypothetical protein
MDLDKERKKARDLLARSPYVTLALTGGRTVGPELETEAKEKRQEEKPKKPKGDISQRLRSYLKRI